MAVEEKNTNNPELEQLLEPEATAQQETTEDNARKGEQSGASIGSAFGLLISVPVGIYSYINSPSRYSAEKLEKKADQYAKKATRTAEKKVKRTLTEDERVAAYDKAQMEYHQNFVRGYRKRADQLAQGSSNKYLLAAIENENNRKWIPVITKNKVQSKMSVPTPVVPMGSENVQKDLSVFAEKISSAKLPVGGAMAPKVSPASGPSMSGAPGKTAPKMPGSRRNPLSKLPRPGLPGGLPNPVQAVRNLAFFLNPTNIIILSLIGIFISVFFIVLLFGGGGGGGGSTVGGGAPPVPPVGGQSTYTFVALGDSLTAWPCYPVDAGCVDSHPWGSYDFTGSPWPTHLATIDTNLILKHNSGLPAKTSAYIESQFGSQVTPYHPDVLFILAGTNDPGNGITNPEVTKANIEKMISDAKSVGIKKVILLTIPHQCGSGYTDINNVIKTLASDYSPVIDISSTSVLACSDFQTSDKLHLTDSGALKLAQYIDGQIINRGLLPAPSSGPANLVFYCQWSPYSSVGGGSWYSHTYTDGTVADKGCGPTSMAIIVSSFGNTQHPDVVGDAFTKDGMMYCDSSGCDGTAYWPGSNPTAIKAWLAGFGLKASDMNLEQGGVLNETGVSKILPQQGSSYLLFGEIKNYIADSNPKLHGGHMVVITAINTSNKTITLYNPEYCHTGNHAETVSYTANIGYGGVPYDWGQIVPFGPVGQ